MKSLYRSLALTVLLGLPLAGSAWAELVIRVTQGNDKPTIVAVSPIALNGLPLSEDIGAIVEADLQRSGLFRSIPRRDMLAFPSRPSEISIKHQLLRREQKS